MSSIPMRTSDMAEEQIVTFETAKLLQEKGFEGQWRKVYSLRSGNLLELSSDNREQFIPAPTQEVVCQWIRQKHQLHIEISVSPIVGKIKGADGKKTCGVLYWLWIGSGEWMNDKYNAFRRAFSVTSKESPEDCKEKSIVHVLKYLI